MSPHALVDLHAVEPSASHGSAVGLQPQDHVSARRTSHLTSQGDDDDVYDLIGVGFGPANLALAIALHDALDTAQPLPGLTEIRRRKPRVAFLERQDHFGWHEGMLLPGTKMQISFMKDLATLRDPRSAFTFLNYLRENDRLVQFTNLGTFLPARLEYQDYMKWCAGWFDDVVQYGSNVTHVKPVQLGRGSKVADGFQVEAVTGPDSVVSSLKARNIVVAIGGKPNIPRSLPQNSPYVVHSSQYGKRIQKILPDVQGSYNIAVLGAGQSAAEVFNDLQSRFPNARTSLIFRSSALRPSDDSPFVNEIFDPERVDKFYGRPEEERKVALVADKATNYAVVRLELLEHIYNMLYMQRLKEKDEEKWQHRILNQRELIEAHATSKGVKLDMRRVGSLRSADSAEIESLTVDAVIVATGYRRDAHEEMLAPIAHLVDGFDDSRDKWHVRRDYKVDIPAGTVSSDAGIWLAGCNEDTHGLSDTLLSILAPRGGELVRSIFGDK